MINDLLDPELLLDDSKLPEVYNLRVEAWEHSPYSFLVNREAFPDGLTDSLDKTAYHFISQRISDKTIMGSGRVNILSDLNDLSSSEAAAFRQFIGDGYSDIGFISRLSIHPEVRGTGLTKAFDYARLLFMKQKGLRICLAYANPERLNRLYSYGFIKLGTFKFKIGGKFKEHTWTAVMIDLKNARI